MDTATRIRVARAAAGMKQSELAELAGVPQSEISRIETGTIRPLSSTVDRLMQALDGHAVDVRKRPTVLAGGHADDHSPGTLRTVDLTGDVSPIDWLVGGMVARGAVTMLAGQEGSGKSMLAQSLAGAAVRGRHSLIGMDVQPARVWIVDAENGEQLIRQRFAGFGMQGHEWQRLRISEARGFDLMLDVEQLHAGLREWHADLVIFDTWTSLWGGSEAFAPGVKRCLNSLRELAQEHGCGVLLLHHTTKTRSASVVAYRGSSAVGGTVEAVFLLLRDELDRRTLRCHKMRLGAEPGERRFRLTGSGVRPLDS